MKKFYVIWSSYDGSYIDEFDEQGLAEQRATEISQKEENDDNGVLLEKVIFGEEMKVKKAEIAIKVKLENGHGNG